MFLMFFPAKRPRDSFCLLPMGKLSFLAGLAKNNNNGETAKDGLAKIFRWKEKTRWTIGDRLVFSRESGRPRSHGNCRHRKYRRTKTVTYFLLLFFAKWQVAKLGLFLANIWQRGKKRTITFWVEIKRKGRDLLPFNELYKICKANPTPEPLFLKRRGFFYFLRKRDFHFFFVLFWRNLGDEE